MSKPSFGLRIKKVKEKFLSCSGTRWGGHAGAPGETLRLLPNVERRGSAGTGWPAPHGTLAVLPGEASLGPAASSRA